ncbi:MAG: peptidoglycan-binding protein [Acidobacteria bacterium]|nr:peptidoglycan-binding protein [Acidobacteriota bacterium]
MQKTEQDIPISVRLRFGSKGPLVTEVQTALKKAGFYEGEIDDDYLTRTLRAVLAYQTITFGDGADNGVVGPMTAKALKVTWPTV